MNKIVYFIPLFMWICSCTNHQIDVENIFTQAENLIESNPDSALVLLDSIHYPDKLNRKQFAEYGLLLVRAKDKAFLDISSDTLILEARRYFQAKGEPEQQALVNLYCGRVQQAGKEYGPAMQSYLAAEQCAGQVQNNRLNGLIQYFMGELCYYEMLENEAMNRFRKAVSYFSRSADQYSNTVMVYRMMGNVLLINEKTDSAFYYYNKGLEIARMNNNSALGAAIRQNLAVAFRMLGDYEKAKENSWMVLPLDSSKSVVSKVYLNLAQIYYLQNMPDSAARCIDKSLQAAEAANDPHTLISAFSLLSNVESENGNYEIALAYNRKFSELLATEQEEKLQRNLLGIEKKYRFELMENANNRLAIEKQRILLFCVFLALCIVAGSFFFYRERMKNKYAHLEAEEKIRQLTELSRGISSRESEYQDLFIHQFKILKNTALLKDFAESEDKDKGKRLLKRFREIVYGENGFDWDLLYAAMNAVNKGELDQIRKAYPELVQEEFKVCCLTYAGFSNSEMSFLLDMSTSSVQARKTMVREKLGVDKNRNFKIYLSEKLKNEKQKSLFHR